MIAPLFDYLERRSGRWHTINGEPAHRFWWWLIGQAFLGRHFRFKGRPRTRALFIGEAVIYPAVWAVWLALHLVGAVLIVPLEGLLGLGSSLRLVLEGLAGPGWLPVLTRRWMGWWMRRDPPVPLPSTARPARRKVDG